MNMPRVVRDGKRYFLSGERFLAGLHGRGRRSLKKLTRRVSNRGINPFRRVPWIFLLLAPAALSSGQAEPPATRSRSPEAWWSYQPLGAAGHGSIDTYIDGALAANGLAQNPPADRRTLIRRATYDLTGLPPSPEEVSTFSNDPDPHAYRKLIDRLLASPAYGERWGRHWLDVVRFGESIGYERNVIIDNAWPFRDYVIRSINEDKPFDQFIREHLAGDVFGGDDPHVEIGSAFLVAGPYDDVGNQDAAAAAQIRANTLDEIIRATSEAFLGMTVGCARCHDHKFDPISQRDYHALYATFAAVRHGDRVLVPKDQVAAHEGALRELEARKDALQAAGDAAADEIAAVDEQIAALPPLPRVWVGTRNADDARGPFHLFLGGNPQKPGERVVPASLSALDGVAPTYRLAAGTDEAQRRLKLAEWITDPGNPLTPRVLANRLWHYHFGTGLVDTPNDFGRMGGSPSHPELLDFLARELQVSGWHLKPMHRRIMLSRAYQQSSAWRADAAAVDGDSRYLWRFPPRRLSAEEIRDTMLSVAGKLDRTMGGPGFRLYQFSQDNVCTYDPLDVHGPETYRRAVYHQNARASVVDLMTDFDQPDCAFSAPDRVPTTSPLQALTLFNHQFTLDMAEALAERLRSGAPDAVGQVALAFQIAYQRDPDPDESARSVAAVRAIGLPAFCRALLNSTELIHLD